MKSTIILCTCILLAQTCSRPDKTWLQASNLSSNTTKEVQTESALTKEQESAFDALNTLQVSTDERNRLYSTFSGIAQPCLQPDTSFTISQKQFLQVMEQFIAQQCNSLSMEEKAALAKKSVLAQEEYTVTICHGSKKMLQTNEALPLTGTWVLPRILDLRDLVIVW